MSNSKVEIIQQYQRLLKKIEELGEKFDQNSVNYNLMAIQNLTIMANELFGSITQDTHQLLADAEVKKA